MNDRYCQDCNLYHEPVQICMVAINNSKLEHKRIQTLQQAAKAITIGGITAVTSTTGIKHDQEKTSTTLPIDSQERKNYPLFEGCVRYFPAALAGVSKTSKLGNDKHNPGEEMHHARGKSMDHGDCIIRHLIDVEDLLAAMKRGENKVTPEGILNEVNQMAWRVLAFSQELHEKFGAPLAPGAKK